ncbi:solute carrier family 23 protein [Caldalkalibacillus salinus]|uniref:solute carrier family 23 protein n=1 Tax=Caldalkalibacillus salinus TaxID=2803787 RepID=UPI001923B2D3
MKKQRNVLDVRDVPQPANWLVLSMQHLFAMFGATILVPFLVGLDASVALMSSGLGTLAYLIITGGKIPAYLGSSFAFIAPITAVMTAEGPEAVMFGSFVAGLVYGIVSLLVMAFGTRWLRRVLPPVVVGPVIIVIGLGLASVAIEMAMYDQTVDPIVYEPTYALVALVTLAVTIIAAIFFKGFFALIPILIGIVGGYVFATIMGIIDFQPILDANWVGMPEQMLIPFVTYTPNVSLLALFVIVPVAFVTLAEHIGDQMVLSKVMDRNLLEKPGLHRSIMGDGVATIIASCIGGPPNTTYGENIGVLAITRIFSIFVVGGAAVLAILFGFSPKVSALIGTIPASVMGGVSILLFGVIASSGLRMMIENNIDFGEKRNLVISSVILVLGIGGAFINIGEHIEVPSMALATIVGIFLNLVLPGHELAYGDKPMFEETIQDQAS